MRGITPDGKTNRAVPSVMFKMGGSWAHSPRRRAARVAPRDNRRMYDLDAADIGVFDSADVDAPLGFINVPVRRLPRDAPLVSTLALTGGATANPLAEITVRAVTTQVSPGAFLFSYFAAPLPRSAYLFANASGDGEGSGGGARGAAAVRGRFASRTRAASRDDGGRHAPRGAKIKRRTRSDPRGGQGVRRSRRRRVGSLRRGHSRGPRGAVVGVSARRGRAPRRAHRRRVPPGGDFPDGGALAAARASKNRNAGDGPSRGG